MEANVPNPSSTSRRLWTLRRATHLASHNRSRETMLEKAVAMLAANGHMPGWFNQCPTTSGIGDSSRTRRSNVDLVHWNQANGHARLVELKWDSDGPCDAMRQILRYGAAYLFCRMYSDRLPVGRAAVMEAREISLQVAAPARYYTESGLRDDLMRAREDLRRFDIGSRTQGLSMSLDVLSFPEWFDTLPFAVGGQVRAACEAPTLTDPGRQVRDAFDRLASVCPEGSDGDHDGQVPARRARSRASRPFSAAAARRGMAARRFDSSKSAGALAADRRTTWRPPEQRSEGLPPGGARRGGRRRHRPLDWQVAPSLTTPRCPAWRWLLKEVYKKQGLSGQIALVQRVLAVCALARG